MMIEMVVSLRYLSDSRQESHSVRGGPTLGQNTLRRVLASLANAKLYLTSGDRKSIDPLELIKARSFLDLLGRRRHGSKRRHQLDMLMLREGTDGGTAAGAKEVARTQPKNMDAHQQLVETELQDTEHKHSSALLHNAWVQKKGRNDFLVLADEAQDPFVTVIPNSIYYNIEKNCANWLDDCSIQGMRMKLLQKVRSPYKK